MRRRLAWATALALAASILVLPVFADASCTADPLTTEEVAEGVTLTWTGSFHCTDDPQDQTYSVEVTVANEVVSDFSVDLLELELTHTTPRPMGQGPDATAEANGLPQSGIAPGDSAEPITVSGTYELVTTDEGDKANLHLQLHGQVPETGEPFSLGINILIRGEGATEDDEEDDDEENDEEAAAETEVGAVLVTQQNEDDDNNDTNDTSDNDEVDNNQEDEDDDLGPRWLRDDAEGWTPGTQLPPPWTGDDGGGGPPFYRDIEGADGTLPGDGKPAWAPPPNDDEEDDEENDEEDDEE